MSARRTASLATGILALLVVGGAWADPSGLLGILGWPGAELWPVDGAWQIAPLVVYVPLLLAGTWWTTHTFAEARWLLFAVWGGVVLSALTAKLAMTLVATGSPGDLVWLAWGTGFTVGKAAIAGLIVGAPVALITRRRRRAAEPVLVEPPRVWTGALTFGLVTVVSGAWVARSWWNGSSSTYAYGGAMPAPTPDANLGAMLAGVVVLVLGAAFWQRARPVSRSAVFLGGWLAAIGAGLTLAVVQTLVGLVTGGFGHDLWTFAGLYVRVCDGVSFGFALGWTMGLAALWARRRAEDPLPHARTPAVAAVAVTLIAAIVVPSEGTAAAPATGWAPLGVSGSTIVDSAGRQVTLRGVNVNQLVDWYAGRPGYPVASPLTERDFKEIAGLGFNTVRLGISWSRLEPRPGSYDAAYVAQIRQAVQEAGRHRIYTVIDMHQDAWSAQPTPARTHCPSGTGPMPGFDGAPAWATKSDGAPRCQFTGRDISPAGDRAFTAFYHDRDGVQTHLVNAWAHLARQVAGEPSVAGYDLLNEPGFGETAPITSSLLLGRYYDRAIRAIRAAERGAGGPTRLAFFEPSVLWSGTGFDAVPPKGFTDDRALVFAPHLYAESITMDATLGLPPIVSMERGFDLAQKTADNYGVPLWSGEWGFFGDDADKGARRFRDLADHRRIGGDAYWVWKQACGDPHSGDTPFGQALNTIDCRTGKYLPERTASLIKEINRPYPRAAPGRLTSLSATNGRLSLAGRTGPGNAPSGGCQLDVWVPGDARPAPVTTGISGLTATRVDGGWRVSGCASGDYTLRLG